MDYLKLFQLDNNKPIVVANQEGVISFVNKALEDLFGWAASEMVNKPLLMIIPEHLHDAHNLGFSRFISTETPTLLDKPLKLAAINKAGEQFTAMHLIQAAKDGDEWYFGANIYPPEE